MSRLYCGSGSSEKVQPGKFIRGRDDRAGIWMHKAFSEGAQYRAVLPTEENVLWIQRSSEGAPSNGRSGFKLGFARAYASGPLLVEKLVDELERKEKLLEQIRTLLKAHA